MLFSRGLKYLSSISHNGTSYFRIEKSIYLNVKRNVVMGHFYVKDKNDNKVILTKSRKVITEDEILKSYAKGEINQIEKDFLLRSRESTPHNIQLYRLLHDQEYANFKTKLASFKKEHKNFITLLLEASAIATDPSGNIEQAINLLEAGKDKFTPQIENIEHAKHLLAFYRNARDKNTYFPIGYFLKNLSLIIKSSLVIENEPALTKLETRLNTFLTRFSYELEPWIFKDFMSNIPKIGEKRRDAKP